MGTQEWSQVIATDTPVISRISQGKCRKWKEGVPRQRECMCKGPVVNRLLNLYDTPVPH